MQALFLWHVGSPSSHSPVHSSSSPQLHFSPILFILWHSATDGLHHSASSTRRQLALPLHLIFFKRHLHLFELSHFNDPNFAQSPEQYSSVWQSSPRPTSARHLSVSESHHSFSPQSPAFSHPVASHAHFEVLLEHTNVVPESQSPTQALFGSPLQSPPILVFFKQTSRTLLHQSLSELHSESLALHEIFLRTHPHVSLSHFRVSISSQVPKQNLSGEVPHASPMNNFFWHLDDWVSHHSVFKHWVSFLQPFMSQTHWPKLFEQTSVCPSRQSPIQELFGCPAQIPPIPIFFRQSCCSLLHQSLAELHSESLVWQDIFEDLCKIWGEILCLAAICAAG